jgi:hypothetical protein
MALKQGVAGRSLSIVQEGVRVLFLLSGDA